MSTSQEDNTVGEKATGTFTRCYTITYITRNGSREKRSYHAKSHKEALELAAEDGITNDIVRISRSSNTLRSMISKFLRSF